ncbi:hypothetical protein [Faecalimonas sp.]
MGYKFQGDCPTKLTDVKQISDDILCEAVPVAMHMYIIHRKNYSK